MRDTGEAGHRPVRADRNSACLADASTEAAAFGVVGALLIALVNGRVSFGMLTSSSA
jgi:hypothetical protein